MSPIAFKKTLSWKPHLSGKFARTAHINLQEMRALKLELKRMCCEDPPSCRLHRRAVIGLDSRVCWSLFKGPVIVFLS